MYISPNDITAFEEQDIETVLARMNLLTVKTVMSQRVIRLPYCWLDSRGRGKQN